MITLKKIASLVWSNRRWIDFGNSPGWDESSFLKAWVDKNEVGLWENKQGWYWFESDITLEELVSISQPAILPAKAARFNEIAQFNRDRLALADIYSPQEGELNVLYSGHENTVFSRLRTHFSLTEENTATGALGISRYPLSNRRWRASFFHEGMIQHLQDLSREEHQILRGLIAEKHSRELVEVCWRIENGWPALCYK